MRVVAYCRVSTDKEDQINSLENQKQYFNEFIKNIEEWELIKIYADEGITGTNTKKRKAFHQMMEDASNDKFDLILTKEVSRFARNTVDTLTFTRKLTKMGIPIHFITDGIRTDTPDGELRLTIMASMAQDESRKTSTRVKFGQRQSMKNGVVFGNGVLGYDLVNGKLQINEKEATVIRQIFNSYLVEGKGAYLISKELLERQVKSKQGNCKWTESRSHENA